MMMRPMAIGILVVPDLEAVYKGCRLGDEMPQRDADRHSEKDPEGEKAIEKRELLARQRGAYLALRDRESGHDLPRSEGRDGINLDGKRRTLQGLKLPRDCSMLWKAGSDRPASRVSSSSHASVC